MCGLYTEIEEALQTKVDVLTTGSLDKTFLDEIQKEEVLLYARNRDMNVLRHIIAYCDDITNTIQRFGLDYNTFKEDTIYINAVALCVLQIGELTT